MNTANPESGSTVIRHGARAVWLLLLVLAVAGSGCRKKTDIDTIPDADAAAARIADRDRSAPDDMERQEVDDPGFRTERPMQEDLDPSPATRSAAEWNDSGVLRTVYFQYDSSDLGERTRATLQENAEWIKGHDEFSIVVEGHCDERGTIEYNLALGQRRANAVRDYLNSLGVRPEQLRVVSYGEERPTVRGGDESAWSRNRRAEFRAEN